MHEIKDIIIVGAGLGGLFSAANLRQLGFSVTVLEAHNKIGGLASWYFRENRQYLFSISPHIVPYSLKKYLKQSFGDEVASHLIPYEDLYFHNDQRQKLGFDKASLSEFLAKILSAEELEFLFSDSAKLSPLSIQEFFPRHFKNAEELMFYLFTPLSNAKGLDLTDPARILLETLDYFMEKGCLTFDKDIFQIMKLVKEELETQGVSIFLQEKVLSVTKDQGGFTLKSKTGEHRAKCLIWNGSLQLVSETFLGTESWEKLAFKQTTSMIQVALGVNADFPQRHNHTLFMKDDPHQGYFHFDLLHQSLMYTCQAKLKDWEGLSEVEYREKKEQFCRDVVKRAHTVYESDFRIVFSQVATPRTVIRYTHHHLGSTFGHKSAVLPLVKELEKQVPGLWICGAYGEDFSGWLGMAKLAKIVTNHCQNFLVR